MIASLIYLVVYIIVVGLIIWLLTASRHAVMSEMGILDQIGLPASRPSQCWL
jgi:hypothetical protein